MCEAFFLIFGIGELTPRELRSACSANGGGSKAHFLKRFHSERSNRRGCSTLQMIDGSCTLVSDVETFVVCFDPRWHLTLKGTITLELVLRCWLQSEQYQRIPSHQLEETVHVLSFVKHSSSRYKDREVNVTAIFEKVPNLTSRSH